MEAGVSLPLLPEHWSSVHRGLRLLYAGFWWNVLGLAPIGVVVSLVGHRRLTGSGPTPTVRRIERRRFLLAVATLAVVPALVICSLLDIEGPAGVAAGIAFAGCTLADYVLWWRCGCALVTWAGSDTLTREWRRVPRTTALALLAQAAFLVAAVVNGSGEVSAPAFLALLLLVPLMNALALLPLWFTSWRTYALFRKPLVPAYAAAAPPPPAGTDRAWAPPPPPPPAPPVR